MKTNELCSGVPTSVQYPCAVRRLSLKWDGKEWSIVHEQVVPSMTLPSPPRFDAPAMRGFWVEAIGTAGRMFHREVMSHPLLGVELFEADGTIRRHPKARTEITIEALIPALPEITEVHVVSTYTPGIAANAKGALPDRAVLKLSSLPRDPARKNAGNSSG